MQIPIAQVRECRKTHAGMRTGKGSEGGCYAGEGLGWVEKGGRAGLLKQEKVITSLLSGVSTFKQHTGH